MNFCWLHENNQKPRNFANLMKISKNNELIPILWKWAKTMEFCWLHENEQKPLNFANFTKMSKTHDILLTSLKKKKKNYEIMPISWKWARTMKFCQFHEMSKNHEILLTSRNPTLEIGNEIRILFFFMKNRKKKWLWLLLQSP